MNKPYAVVFAGVPGSSKTIISNYLSVKYNLPVFNNDQLRFEVKEDMMTDNINRPDVLERYERVYIERFEELLRTGNSMILDGSIDRRWVQTKQQLQAHGYSWFMISIDLSKEFLDKFFIATGRPKFLDKLPKYIQDHNAFLEKYSSEVSLHITDDTFKNRIHLAANNLKKFLAGGRERT